jgi:transcriptional/translational regulatory protein YebC/TACO1
VGEVRHAFTKIGGNLGTSGSVNYLFHHTGILGFPSGANEDQLMEATLEAGANDIIRHEDGSFEVTTSPDQFLSIKDTLAQAGFTTEYAESTWIATIEIALNPEQQQEIQALIDSLEDLDDVQQVYTNAQLS